ncbi:helix-turn-helix transcriptional regulator [Pseudomonas sp. 681]|uniref:Helix-turn-helix transcriptional regulator n=1 Tax=Pseudomonas fungipugnans TaxID=3024217 RepID=A0ABT6QT55_9PSED|nr:helix-turn-helix transcriptional regulator [Pseudomonas sp. 681]MDI2594082.1 helix-turn-helix transcriptional regulator [Pseudomonas sp. 681]
MNYSQRIKAARSHAGLTQSELARLVGIDQTSISNLERGKSQGSSHTASIAKACGVSAIWLEAGLGEMTSDYAIIDRPTPSNAQAVGPFNIWDHETPLDESEIYLPFLKEVPGTPDNPRHTVVLASDHKIRFDRQILKRQGINTEDAVCVTVVGNNMEPIMPDGSTVAIDMANTDVIDGKIYAIDHDGQLRVVVLYRLRQGGVRLRSYNRDEHPDEVYSLEETIETKLIILGKAFWYSVIL